MGTNPILKEELGLNVKLKPKYRNGHTVTGNADPTKKARRYTLMDRNNLFGYINFSENINR